MEIKTTEDIIDIFESIGHDPQNEEFLNKKWVSVEKDFDLYRYMINKYGKAKIWSLNTDELLDLVEKQLKGEQE